MAKNKETVPEILDEEIREEEQPSVKGPLRDDPEPAYTPAWQVVNRRQDVYADKFPPKIYSLEALMATGLVTEEMLEEAGYVKFTDYASTSKTGVVRINDSYGFGISPDGEIRGVNATLQQYNNSPDYRVINKGTMRSIRSAVVTDGMLDYARSSIVAQANDIYAIRMQYDGTNWSIIAEKTNT